MLEPIDLIYFKEQSPGHKIIYLSLCGAEFVFKTISKKDYSSILQVSRDDYDKEDMIAQVGLVYPEKYVFKDSPIAGVPAIAAGLIIRHSGFLSQDDIMQVYEEEKQKMASFEQQCMALIKTAFPETTFDEMEDWTWQRIISAAVKAEYILNIKGHDFRFDDNREEMQAQQDSFDEEAFVQELRLGGGDPMYYYQHLLKPKKAPYMDHPLLGGSHWRDDGVLNEIRRQMA